MNSIIEKKSHNEGDGDFSRLIDECKKNLYRIAFAHLKNEQNSLDAVSETIYKAYMNISELKIKQFFNTWVIKILINSCNDIIKTNNKVVYIDEYNRVDRNKNDDLGTEFKIANNIDLYNAIDKLNEKFKSIVILKYLEDMTTTQISEVLDLPEGTVKVYLRRAIGILKLELGEECV